MSHNPSLGICTFGIFVASILFDASSTLADDRPPIPDEASQKEAAALVREVFGKDIENATTADQRLALTKKLLKEASRSDTTPQGRYALLQTALDNAPDASVAMPIIDEMARRFQIDGLKAKASTVWRMANDARTLSQHTAVAEVALQLVDESVNRDAYDPAMTLAEIALIAAQSARDGKLVQVIRTRALEVRKQQAEFEKVQEATAVLAKEPTNAEANLTVGRYRCFAKSDWEGGIPMLALGGDDALKNLAVQELKMPTKSDEQVGLADGWYDLAQKSDAGIRERMLQRAGFWYQLALKSTPALTRLVKAKVEKRLEQIGALGKEQAHKKTINLLSLIKLSQHVVRGNWSLTKSGELEAISPAQSGKDALLALPITIPDEFIFRATFTRLKVDQMNKLSDMFVWFVLGKSTLQFVVRTDARLSGNPTIISFWPDSEHSKKPTLGNPPVGMTLPKTLLNRRKNELVCNVRENKISVAFNGKELFVMHGDDLTLVRRQTNSGEQKVMLQVWNNHTIYHSLEVTYEE